MRMHCLAGRQPLFLAEELVGIPMQNMDGSLADHHRREKTCGDGIGFS